MQIKPCVIRVYIYLSKPAAWLGWQVAGVLAHELLSLTPW